MSERDLKKQTERREQFLEQLKESKAINLDASISSILESTSKLPDGTLGLTVLYDDDKYFAIMK